MAKNGNGKHPSPAALVARAEEHLRQATGAVKANRDERESRVTAAQRLRREIGDAPDAPRSEKLSARVVALQSRVAVLDADLPALEKTVQEAEAALTTARKAEAASRIAEMARRLDGLSGQIRTGLEEVAVLIGDHSEISAEAAEVARAHHMPAPAKHRWLLPAKLIRSHGGEALRNALDRARAVGITGDQPVARA